MRKNVLIFGHDYNAPFVDVFNQYTRLFDKDKFCVTVAYLTGEPNEEIKQNTLAENVIFINIPKKNIRSLKIGAIKKLLALTREKQFQIVVCHRYKPAYIMMWVAKFHTIPALIAVMHELRTMSSINRQMLIAALARKNMLFAGVSNAVREDMRKHLWFVPDERIMTLYNVIDAQLVEPQLLPKETARNALQLSGVPAEKRENSLNVYMLRKSKAFACTKGENRGSPPLQPPSRKVSAGTADKVSGVPAEKRENSLNVYMLRKSKAFACTKGENRGSPPLQPPSRKVSAGTTVQLSDNDFVFGHLGRLVKNKDQESLIRAFALIKPSCPHAKLVIIGAGELGSHLKQITISLGLQDSVLFTGFLSGGFRYMKAFDRFVLSSIQEAFGRVLLEAMLARLPLIATRIHGIPEVVDEAGLLVPPNDVQAMAAAMQQLYELSESERTLLANKAHERAVNHFSIARFQKQFWELPLVHWMIS